MSNRNQKLFNILSGFGGIANAGVGAENQKLSFLLDRQNQDRQYGLDDRKLKLQDILDMAHANYFNAQTDALRNPQLKPANYSNEWDVLAGEPEGSPLYNLALKRVTADNTKINNPRANAFDQNDFARMRGQAQDDARTSLRAEFHTEPTLTEQFANMSAVNDNQPLPYPPGKAPALAEIYPRADSNFAQMLGIPMEDVRVGGMTDQYVMDILNAMNNGNAGGQGQTQIDPEISKADAALAAGTITKAIHDDFVAKRRASLATNVR